MIETALPTVDQMYRALVERDAGYEGIFVVGVRTTGIFCRPTCPARKPLRENVEFFSAAQHALASGYRPCRRCRPLEPAGAVPDWLRSLIDDVEADPTRRWRDGDLRARDLDPARVRRWFQAQHGMTFHAYLRARRLGHAFAEIREGRPLLDAGLDAGWESSSGFREAFERWYGSPPGTAREGRAILATRLTTPLGPMIAAAVDEGVCLLEFADRRMLETQVKRLASRLSARFTPGRHAHLDRLEEELADYFAGRRLDFDVPLHVPGSPFQQAVWQALQRIPPGEVSTYGRMARQLGREGAQRAIGRANGDNRLAILIPCHRVVREDGSLCGYGGGIWRKRWLLQHEGFEGELGL